MKRTKAISLPAARIEVALDAATLDLDARTMKMAWYTGATVERMSFFDGPYQLSFSMDEKAVDLSRLNSGRAPFKAGHTGYSDVGAVIGKVEKAWLEDGVGYGAVRFSSRPELEPMLQDIRDGILANVSMEAAILELEDVTEKGAEEKHYLARRWQPMAVALVQVGADPNAQALTSGHQFTCQLSYGAEEAPLERTKLMMKVRLLATNEIVEILESDFDPAKHSKTLDVPKMAPVALEGSATTKVKIDMAIQADKERAAEIRRVQDHFGLDDIWAQKHIKQGSTADQVLLDAQEQRLRINRDIDGSVKAGDDFDSWHFRSEQMALAIAARSTGKAIPESARQFAHYGFVDLAHEVIKSKRLAPGIDVRNRPQVINLALSTTDFPNLLANAGNKVLLPAYQAASETYRLLCIRQDVADFKSVSILNTGDFPAPLQVGENGEIKLGYFAEQNNTVALGTYGRRLQFSRKMLINDDLSAFGRVMGAYGVRVADYENAAFFALLSTIGPTLGDGGAMFNATALTTAGGHANYTSSGTAISDTSITVGYALMAAQTGIGSDNLGDGIKLNILPKYLLAAPGKRNLAYQYTSPAYTPAAPTSLNSWAGVLTPVLDANLSGNRWWLFADPALFPNFAYGSLIGEPGPRVATRPGFEVEGVEMRVAFDFYVGGIDWRGGYCNVGA